MLKIDKSDMKYSPHTFCFDIFSSEKVLQSSCLRARIHSLRSFLLIAALARTLQNGKCLFPPFFSICAINCTTTVCYFAEFNALKSRLNLTPYVNKDFLHVSMHASDV